MDKQTEIKHLEDQIGHANAAYWGRNDQIMSDAQYDQLVLRLRALDPDNPLCTRLVSDTTSGAKIKHEQPMLSLDKVYSYGELLKWCRSVARDGKELFSFSPKYDGISIELTNGKLITRGKDGITGTDITHLAPWILARFSYEKGSEDHSMHMVIENHKHLLHDNIKTSRHVGELLIPLDRFEKLKNSYPCFSDMKNPRNTAAGFSNWKADSENLKTLIYAGLPVPVCTWVNHRAYELTLPLSELDDKEAWLIKKLKNFKNTPCDGIVCRLTDVKYGDTLGVTQHHPKSAIALKFKDEEYTSVVREIEWGVGNETVTPVVIFDPVYIDGSEIKRASCHNARFVLDNKLTVGATVTIEKRGMVIPTVTKVEPVKDALPIVPKVCPSCGQTLVKDDVDLFCINKTCVGRCTNKIVSGLHILGIKGIGPSLVEKMVREFYIPDIMFWATQSWDKDLLLKKGFSAHEIKLITTEFDRVTDTGLPDETVFSSLCIPEAAESFAVKVIKYTGSLMTLVEDPNVVREKLKGCPGLNTTALNNTIDFMIEHPGEFEAYYDLFTHARPIDMTSRTKYCMTGVLPFPRKKVDEWILDHGGYPTENIRQADYLVSDTPTSTSSKMKYARSHGIPVITFAEMQSQLSK